MSAGFAPDKTTAQPSSEQRVVVKAKTVGRLTQEPQRFENLSERAVKLKDKVQREDSKDSTNKKFADILEKSAEMRHLEYEIIEDAKMIQIRVINTKSGEIIRKIPQDKVVNLVRKIRQNKDKRLDVKA